MSDLVILFFWLIGLTNMQNECLEKQKGIFLSAKNKNVLLFRNESNQIEWDCLSNKQYFLKLEWQRCNFSAKFVSTNDSSLKKEIGYSFQAKLLERKGNMFRYIISDKTSKKDTISYYKFISIVQINDYLKRLKTIEKNGNKKPNYSG